MVAPATAELFVARGAHLAAVARALEAKLSASEQAAALFAQGLEILYPGKLAVPKIALAEAIFGRPAAVSRLAALEEPLSPLSLFASSIPSEC